MSKIHLHDGFHKENDVMLAAHAAHFKPFFFGSFRDTVPSNILFEKYSFCAEYDFLRKVVKSVSPYHQDLSQKFEIVDVFRFFRKMRSLNHDVNIWYSRSQEIITKEYQKRSKNSVSAQVAAILAVVTVIKDC